MVSKLTFPTTQNQVLGKVNEIIDDKQDNLVSGTNIKTINGQSILGGGNIEIGGSGEITNPLTFSKTSGSTTYTYTVGFNGNNRFYTNVDVSTGGGGSTVAIPGIYTVSTDDALSVSTTTASNSVFESVRNFAISLGNIDCGTMA